MDETMIEVELDSAAGPRVLVSGDADHDEILAELPEGWTVHVDDWSNGVRTDSGGWSYPLSREATAPDKSSGPGDGLVVTSDRDRLGLLDPQGGVWWPGDHVTSEDALWAAYHAGAGKWHS